MLDVIIYDDSRNFDYDGYVYTIEQNKYLRKIYDDIHFIMFTLLKPEENQALQVLVDSIDHCTCTLIATPQFLICNNILFTENRTVETAGFEYLLKAVKGSKVLFLRKNDRVKEPELKSFDPEDYNNFDLSGVVIDTKNLLFLLDHLHYSSYITSDMLYFYLISFPGYHNAKKVSISDHPPYPHNPTALSHLYQYLQDFVYYDLRHTDRSDLIREAAKRDLEFT